jgi:hypothetical protein
MKTDFRDRIFNIKEKTDFLKIALEVFNYQYDKNAVYQDFITSLKKLLPATCPLK